MHFFAFFLLLFFTLSISGNENPVIHKHNRKTCFFKFGDNLISIARHGEEKESAFVLISLHSNETTAIDGARIFIKNEGGLFLELLNYDQRLIEFNEGERKFSFDPNRIFTPAGRIANLKLNKSYVKMVEHQVQQFAKFILNEIPGNKTIIAVHNNTEGKYTINEYKKGNKLEKDAKLIYQNNELDEDDFFLTTDPSLFKKLQSKKFNVVLQHNSKAKDDGSLSVYCAKNNRPYVNIETEHGHLEEQQKMLSVLNEIIGD